MAEMGNEDWGYEDLLPYFKRGEDFVPGDGEYHGEGGPLTVAEQVDPHPVSEALVDGMAEAGIERNPDFNGEQQEGCGFCHLTQRDGRRCSTAKAYIDSLVEGGKLAREVADTDALAEYCGPEVSPGPEVTTDAEIREFVREYATTVYHPVGTCRMSDDEMAVVDNTLQVHGIEGLRVADASVMPRITAGNTNAPTIAIAEKAADLVTETVSAAADD